MIAQHELTLLHQTLMRALELLNYLGALDDEGNLTQEVLFRWLCLFEVLRKERKTPYRAR